jgi:hypothetical protein
MGLVKFLECLLQERPGVGQCPFRIVPSVSFAPDQNVYYVQRPL